MGFFSIKKKKYVTLTTTTNENPVTNGVTDNEIDQNKDDKLSSPLWVKCPECNEIIYKEDIESNLNKCTSCNYYFYMSPQERIQLLIDDTTFVEFDNNLCSNDPLLFPEYKDKYKIAVEKTENNSAVLSGTGEINKIKVSIAILNFAFMGGSMGSVVGEKITRAIERGYNENIPVIVISTSGGARMQEGIFSLMQMAKTSSSIERLKDKGIPFISIPLNPTTGGITASFAMLGDFNITEPGALIGFAGPRVIEQTIKQKLPEGFQKSEFLQKFGMIDIITKREEMKETLTKLLTCTTLGRDW